MHLTWIATGLELANHVLSADVSDGLINQDPIENRMFIFHHVARYWCSAVIYRGLPYESVIHGALGAITAKLLDCDVYGFSGFI